MKTLSKFAAAAALTGTLALVAATPSQARWDGHGWHRYGPAAAIGFGAGAILGAAAATAAYPAYYYGDDYGPDYAYVPGPYESYAYEPGPGYSGKSDGAPACAGSLGYGRPDYSSC
jgi:hypothetical protein